MTLAPWLANPHPSPGSTAPRDTDTAAVRAFHRSLPGYRETPLVPLPRVAEELGLRAVLVKDESSRLGLPAFKMLGASWAVYRALAGRCDPVPAPDLQALRAALAGADMVRLVTATDGNHGRAVARMGALLDLPVTVVIPRGVSQTAIELIRGEGCEVHVLDRSYDDAVRYAADLAEADPAALLVQDTSWPGYEEVPQWIVDGYATLFSEAAEQAAAGGLSFDALFVPVGVGSLAHAAVLFAATQPDCAVVAVEPDTAACVHASLASGELTSVETATTIMAGLNCGTPSYLAWPDLAGGLSGSVMVTDEQATAAMEELPPQGSTAARAAPRRWPRCAPSPDSAATTEARPRDLRGRPARPWAPARWCCCSTRRDGPRREHLLSQRPATAREPARCGRARRALRRR